MTEKEFWDNISSTYSEELNKTFEEFIKIRYFSFINRLFSYRGNKTTILKTDGWDLVHTLHRNPYNLLRNKSDSIIVTDISKSLLDNINKKYSDINTRVCKVQELGKIFSSKIDLLIDLSTIDHVPEEEVEMTIKSYKETLSDNGYALIVFWKKSWHYHLLNILYSIYKLAWLKPFYNEEKANQDGQYYFNESNIIKLIKRNGIKIVYKKRFGVLMNFLGKIKKLQKYHIVLDDFLSYFSGSMCAIIIKKV